MNGANGDHVHLGRKLHDKVLTPMKQAFVGKDELIDLLGVCLVARENLFVLGPPGTAKSAVVHDLARRIDGRIFDYLLTRFTEPNELFGPFDIRRLRDGELVTNTEGMIPEADFVFLDELLNANSAILNSLLLVLNERIFRRGRETAPLPTLIVVGASNVLPEDDALGALFDRFLVRVHCDNVGPEELANVLVAGWNLDSRREPIEPAITVDEIRLLQKEVDGVELDHIRKPYVEMVHRLRHAGVSVSDRRAVKLQRILAASALLCGRRRVVESDLWVLRYIWDTNEQREVLAAIVGDAIAEVLDASVESGDAVHPRAQGEQTPDAEHLARDLERIGERLDQPNLVENEVSYLRDQLGVLQGRVQWVRGEQQRTFLEQKVQALWPRFSKDNS